MLLDQGPERRLGTARGTRLQFSPETRRTRTSSPGRRLLVLDGEPAFELAYWCGTCPLLFQRLGGAQDATSLEDLEQRLAAGLDTVDDDVVQRFGALLPAGTYLPLLLSVSPRLVGPDSPDDYFSHEQVVTWGIDPFHGVPEDPGTPYYRTFETPVHEDGHLYEFVVPLVPPSVNDPARVARHAALLQTSSAPTAVAVALLDVCQPDDPEDSADHYAHWGLTHFLLDGHHKLQAAAELARPLRLLSLLSLTDSLALPADLARVPELRQRAPAARRPAGG